ncbi:galactose-proton symporter [Salmonella enterica subsp. enterica]|nr:galactose-proton symporter [Salmonella enterica subsp. enterica] [Salmonella enterica subsp. enterica serovar Menston]
MMHIGIHSAVCAILRYRYAADVHHWICDERWSADWVLCSEIQPLKGPRFRITCSTATNWIANMIVGATFLTMLNNLGNAKHLLGLRWA